MIGLNLDKYNELGSIRGNGLRISSAPIEFNYSCAKIADTTVLRRQSAAVNLQFFIEFRRSMIIQPLGVTVSDV